MDEYQKFEYLRIARSVGIFEQHEIDVLDSVFDDSQTRPEDGYIIFDERRDDNIVGFVIFGRAPITAYGWEIYWMAVDKDYQGQGIGRSLIKRMFEYILTQADKAIIRVETSTRKEYAHARNLYVKQKFQEAGRIADFYGAGDDLIIYYHVLARVPAAPQPVAA